MCVIVSASYIAVHDLTLSLCVCMYVDVATSYYMILPIENSRWKLSLENYSYI